MKPLQFYKSILLMTLAGLILSWNALSVYEEYPIDTDEKAKEMASYNWECEWKDAYCSGTSTFVYESAMLKKVTGKVKNSYCPDG